jgi:hypothetical protein
MKAMVPSKPSNWPKKLPTERENGPQFVPNWNSSGMPLTTPTAKPRTNNFAQNLYCRRYRGSRFFSHIASKYTRKAARPMDVNGQMMWNMVVSANCSRERKT